MKQNGCSVTGKKGRNWHYDYAKGLGTKYPRWCSSVMERHDKMRERRRNHRMTKTRVLFTIHVHERVLQKTEVLFNRSRLIFSKSASRPGGGIAMSGDVRGYGDRVETRALHTGAAGMPERYQVYLDFT